MSVIACGARPDSDGLGELIRSGALDDLSAALGRSRPGWRLRLHPNHMPTIDRNECEAYVPGCTCSWLGPDSGDVVTALAAWPAHMLHLTAQAERHAA